MMRKFYVRSKGGFPASEPQSTAFLGFRERGIEAVLFEEGAALADLSQEVGVAGYIGDVWRALEKLGKPRPPSFDYPDALEPFLGRRVWQTTAREALDRTEEKLFVKSVHQKLLTGFAFTGKYRDKIKMAGISDDEPMWLSDAVNFVSEYRCFVLRGEILDARLYKGDWGVALDRKVVEAAAQAWPEAPVESRSRRWTSSFAKTEKLSSRCSGSSSRYPGALASRPRSSCGAGRTQTRCGGGCPRRLEGPSGTSCPTPEDSFRSSERSWMARTSRP